MFETTDIDSAIKEIDKDLLALKRIKRKVSSMKRILAAEQRARVRKIVQNNYKVQLAQCVDACIQCGLIDKDLNLL